MNINYSYFRTESIMEYPSWITFLSWRMDLCNSMKLWVMPCGAIQDEWIKVKVSDEMWPTERENGKPLLYSCLENPMNGKKMQKYMTLEDETPGWKVSNMLLEKSRGQLLELLKEWSCWANAEMETAVDLSDGENKVQCCKKQYCIRA